MELLIELIKVSEKAANVARIIRKDEHLFRLLVQEKSDAEANPRFVTDFKTLADVLIQEVVKHDIGLKFPELKSKIRGEENNVFCNRLGKEITVEIKSTTQETSKLLETVLNGDQKAADILSEELHKNIDISDVKTIKKISDFDLDMNNLGIWIDPIDSTAEYINGSDEITVETPPVSGLNCVTVLIGVFDTTNGVPIVGVINQPFAHKNELEWTGECYWGVSTEKSKQNSIENAISSTNNICISGSEKPEIKGNLSNCGYNLIEAAGAGYKILLVIKGLSDLYILSNDSTFKWDTCGPQAILRSMGGDVVVFKDVHVQIKSQSYLDVGNNCNVGGLIAFRSRQNLDDILNRSSFFY